MALQLLKTDNNTAPSHSPLPSSSRGAERTLTIYEKIRNAKISVQLLMRRNERNKGVTARILLIVDSEEYRTHSISLEAKVKGSMKYFQRKI